MHTDIYRYDNVSGFVTFERRSDKISCIDCAKACMVYSKDSKHFNIVVIFEMRGEAGL